MGLVEKKNNYKSIFVDYILKLGTQSAYYNRFNTFQHNHKHKTTEEKISYALEQSIIWLYILDKLREKEVR